MGLSGVQVPSPQRTAQIVLAAENSLQYTKDPTHSLESADHVGQELISELASSLHGKQGGLRTRQEAAAAARADLRTAAEMLGGQGSSKQEEQLLAMAAQLRRSQSELESGVQLIDLRLTPLQCNRPRLWSEHGTSKPYNECNSSRMRG